VILSHNPSQAASAHPAFRKTFTYYFIFQTSSSTSNLVSSIQFHNCVPPFTVSPRIPQLTSLPSKQANRINKAPRFHLVASHPETIFTEYYSIHTHEEEELALNYRFSRFFFFSIVAGSLLGKIPLSTRKPSPSIHLETQAQKGKVSSTSQYITLPISTRSPDIC
jgi:hypothetical protein